MLHNLHTQQAAAALKAALIGFAVAIDNREDPLPDAIIVTLTVRDEDVEASYELVFGKIPLMGGSL
jgi:hypothetical protein